MSNRAWLKRLKQQAIARREEIINGAFLKQVTEFNRKESPFCVYRYVTYLDGGYETIYIGKTRSLSQRISQHKHEFSDIDYTVLFYDVPYKALMDSLERLLIHYYKPLLNIVGNCIDDINVGEFSSLVWKKYCDYNNGEYTYYEV